MWLERMFLVGPRCMRNLACEQNLRNLRDSVENWKHEVLEKIIRRLQVMGELETLHIMLVW